MTGSYFGGRLGFQFVSAVILFLGCLVPAQAQGPVVSSVAVYPIGNTTGRHLVGYGPDGHVHCELRHDQRLRANDVRLAFEHLSCGGPGKPDARHDISLPNYYD
jgi:hypothetical protein